MDAGSVSVRAGWLAHSPKGQVDPRLVKSVVAWDLIAGGGRTGEKVGLTPGCDMVEWRSAVPR